MTDRNPVEVAEIIFSGKHLRDPSLALTAREVMLFGWQAESRVRDFIFGNFKVTSKAFVTRRTNKLYDAARVAMRNLNNNVQVENSIWEVVVNYNQSVWNNDVEYFRDQFGQDENLFKLFDKHDIRSILERISSYVIGYVSAIDETNAKMAAAVHLGPLSQSKYAIYRRHSVGYDDKIRELNAKIAHDVKFCQDRAQAYANIAQRQAEHYATLAYFLQYQVEK